MKDIVIIGAGGFAKEVAFLIEEINKAASFPMWNLLGYAVAELIDKDKDTPVYNGKYPVVMHEDRLLTYEDEIAVAFGIGSPKILRNVYQKLKGYPHITFPNVIHPNMIFDSDRIEMGVGNVICAGNIFTTDIVIGSCNVFNLQCTYGHDVIIGDFSVFNPGVNLSGGVHVEGGSLIGTGAKILQYIKIGHNAIVGAGAVVTKDVLPDTTVIGVPAKPLTRTT